MDYRLWTLVAAATAVGIVVAGGAALPTIGEISGNVGTDTDQAVVADASSAEPYGVPPLSVPAKAARLRLPAPSEIERRLRSAGHIGPDASDDEIDGAVRTWIGELGSGMRSGPQHLEPAVIDRALANEKQALTQAPMAAVPVTAAVLAIPVEFTATETLDYLVHNHDGSQCITVTNTFTRPLHGSIPYPGGNVTDTIDNQTVYYPSTEPEDYTQLIFGRDGYTEPLRAGDPNVNDGAGVDISGLTVQTYFDAQSDGTANLTGEVAPWVGVPHTQAYYGIDGCIPNLSPRALPDEQIGSLADLAVRAAEAVKASGERYATYDFWSQFDDDGNGWIDTLWIIHAGRGQEYGGGTDGAAAIWSRAAHLMSYDDYRQGYTIHDNGTPDTSDDIRIGSFNLLPEDSDLGVLVEEFGHSFFGLPDLYTMNSSNSVGWWAPMSAGIWGGELGGTSPVNMPLFFRTVADCRGEPCGWADPVKSMTYTTPGETVFLGQAGEPTGGSVPDPRYEDETLHEGLRIELPEQVEVLPNKAGEGGGAYSGSDLQTNLTLDQSIDLSEVTGPVFLTLDSHLVVQRIWGYAYLEVSTDGETFESLPDVDGVFNDDDPMGIKRGTAATGDHDMEARFDLTRFAGNKPILRFRFFTYQGAPGSGWWIDNIGISGDVLDEDFEDGLGRWTTGGWIEVPLTKRHAHHYLVEWRNDNGFDAALKGAYQTAYSDQDEWRVDRVPANVPGAVVMYRNLRYPLTGSFVDNLGHPPSYGSKYGLLVVDTNFWPTERPSGGAFSGRLESLNAPLALQDQADFELEVRPTPSSREAEGTEVIQGAPGVEEFNDALGYYPGFKTEILTYVPHKPDELWDEDASVVVPAYEDRPYSTRVTYEDKSRPTIWDDVSFGDGHVFGSGDPGDANAHFGVHIEVVDAAEDGSWGAVRVYNSAVDYGLDASSDVKMPGEVITFTLRASNRGSMDVPITYTLSLFGDDVLEGSVNPLAIGDSHVEPYSITIPVDYVSYYTRLQLQAEAVFDDGSHEWRRTLYLMWPRKLFLPALDTGDR